MQYIHEEFEYFCVQCVDNFTWQDYLVTHKKSKHEGVMIVINVLLTNMSVGLINDIFT